jgi:hypothetical protein
MAGHVAEETGETDHSVARDGFSSLDSSAEHGDSVEHDDSAKYENSRRERH